MRRNNSMRYRGYDYTVSGAYFVTICAEKGRSIFGQVIDNEMHLNPLGQIAHDCWQTLARNHQATIDLPAACVMPNHTHALLIFKQLAAAGGSEPVARRFGQPIAGSLSALVGAYKAEVTRQAKAYGLIPAPPLWQRNFWYRIVRDDQEVATVRDYIVTNPVRWLADQLHPKAIPNPFNRTWPREDDNA